MLLIYVYTIIYFATNRFYIYKSFLLERVRVQNIDGCDNICNEQFLVLRDARL